MRISTLVVTAAATTVTALAGSLATAAKDSGWYARLRKPRYQPPAQAFPVVWPALYADIASVSAATLDHLRDTDQHAAARAYTAALGVNLILNGSWSWLFFNRRALATSAAVAAALTVSSVDLSRRAIAARPSTGAPLVLYPLWCAFATMLATHIWLLNRRTSE